jgi:hypothetical protein
MGDWPRLVNLRRCARCHAVDTGEANNTTIALTNDSLGADLVLVWQMASDTTGGGTLQVSYQQMPPMGTLIPVQSVVPGEGRPPGVVSSGDQPNAFTPDWQPLGQFGEAYWPATFPFAVLLPGWSLVFQPAGGGNGQFGVNIFWEGILEKYFDRFYTHAFLEVILATQGG